MSIKPDLWIARKSEKPSFIGMINGERKFLHHRADREIIEELHEIDKQSYYDVQRAIKHLTPVTEKDLADWKPMIEPFMPRQVRSKKGADVEVWDGIAPTHESVISYGNSSYGYDVRVADEFKIFTNVNGGRVDPKNFDGTNYVIKKGPELVIPPNGFALARTVEYMRIPRNVLVVCLGKSTYARCGIIVNVTPLEPEWEGHVTLEFSNTTSLPAVVYANEGVAQFLFFESDEACEISYKDRNGKYQGQTGVTDPRI